MTEKEFRHLSRRELVEIIYQLQKENMELQSQNSELKNRLEDKNLKLSRVGSIAEAAMELNGVFAAAQAAADQYVNEIRKIRDRKIMESGLSDGQA